MSWTPVGFAIKLPETSRSALVNQHGAKYLRYFPNGPIKKDYVVLPKSMWHETRTLGRLAKTSIKYVLSLPAPIKKKKSPITRRLSGRGKRRHTA